MTRGAAPEASARLSGVITGSTEKTHRSPSRSADTSIPAFRSPFRTFFARGHPCTSSSTPARTAVGSLRRAAPILEITGMLCDKQAHISDTLSHKESIASTTTSGLGLRIDKTFSSLIRTSKASTWQAGAISWIRSVAISAFGLPIVECSANSWRLMLEGSTRSKSTIRSRPTPERARASAAKEPTAPRPATMTRAPARRARASCPSRRSTRDSGSSSGFMDALRP